MTDKDAQSYKEEYIDRMVKNLPVLRASIRITQKELAQKIGITRQSMMNIETRRRPLQWSTYLALVLVFQQAEESRKLFESLRLFDGEIINPVSEEEL